MKNIIKQDGRRKVFICEDLSEIPFKNNKNNKNIEKVEKKETISIDDTSKDKKKY